MRRINFRGIEGLGIGLGKRGGGGGAPSAGITDYDGNVYTSVIIGSQEWLVENLKTTHYNNGDPITQGFAMDTIPRFDWYDSDIGYKEPYGALYNSYLAKDQRGVAPLGFRVTTFNDWNTLIKYILGVDPILDVMYDDVRNKLCIESFFPPHTTNELGLSIYPSGLNYGDFEQIDQYTVFWNNNDFLLAEFSTSGAAIFDWESYELPFTLNSIRCMRDI